MRTAKVRFTSTDNGSTWQFRTIYEGGEAVTFRSISLTKLD
jgi:hypothetical protein